MDKERFEYEMKRAGYKTPFARAEAMGLSLGAYYRRVNGECECTQGEIQKVLDIVGKDAVHAIFFS